MKKILIMAIGAGLLLTGCSKDFLDLDSKRFVSKDNNDKISETSPHLSEATMNGLYAYNLKIFTGGTTGHDDFGQKGYDIYSDMLSGDMNLNSAIYGWYRGIANLQDPQNYASNTNYKPWRFYYYMVRGANNVIESQGGNDAVPEANDLRKVLAEAKAFRAYLYYNLMNLYTKGYDANEKILPIYTEPVLHNLPSKSTQEVFDLMIKDLTDAVSLFELAGVPGKGKNINGNVAKAFLAYVYAAKGTNEALLEAQRLSQEVMGQYPLATEAQLLGGFNKMAQNPNWIWGAEIGIENDLDLVSWWGQVDVFTYSYASVGDTKGMGKELYQAIDTADVRSKQFSNKPVVGNNGTIDFGPDAYLPIFKFYAPARNIQGQRLIETDYVFMRVEEMYLLHAEVSARLGQDAVAIQTLKDLLSNRMPDVAYLDGLSGQALLDEVILQTRIELWGEGKVYAAIKRTKGEFSYGSNHLFFPNQKFSYDDPKLTLAVPQNEILNNPVYND